MSHEMHHFSMGSWVFFLAYATSVLGSYVGLSCVRQSVSVKSGHRTGWIVLASVTIGGIGIWLMHFIGMMGFDVVDSVVRYDLVLTLVSVVLAIGATLIGLWIAGFGDTVIAAIPPVVRLLIGGTIMGLAVSLMHYTGMAAVRIQGTIDYKPGFVVASVIIGLVAANVALWLGRVSEKTIVRVPAALVMGLAVVALHYTGMAGVDVTVDPSAPRPEGLTVLSLLFPAFTIGILVLALAIVVLGTTLSRDDAKLEESLTRWSAEGESASPAAPDNAPTV
ncbi:MAG: MHYT domain-containing protein [Rhodococcus sp. (in: high G+C Gram-positive bacteria)]|uniref:MHYT domain-containing protein n=1 Tax=Rhodococcus sp. TaxID=1831 RepID=UPI003BB79426